MEEKTQSVLGVRLCQNYLKTRGNKDFIVGKIRSKKYPKTLEKNKSFSGISFGVENSKRMEKTKFLG